MSLLNTEAAPESPAPEPEANAACFVIQSGIKLYGPFDTDDEAFGWAVTKFDEFNIKPVFKP